MGRLLLAVYVAVLESIDFEEVKIISKTKGFQIFASVISRIES